jgi:phenylalanyl-tRNA synthetase alpha chain
MIEFSAVEWDEWFLTEEGATIAREGSHEKKVFDAVPKEGIEIKELEKALPSEVVKVGQGKAFKNKWIKKDGSKLVRLVDAIQDETQVLCQQISKLELKDVNACKDLKKRKLCDVRKQVYYRITKGPEFALEVKKQATDVTLDMLSSKSWRNQDFKQYNFSATGIAPECGYFHPLMKVRAEYRQIFFEMGFEEMPTNRYVESSFWNFDALFQPQDHPARDMHDTFFCKQPSKTDSFPEEYLKRVQQVHSHGGFGSTGHQCDWKRREAETLLLRTHTTAVSSNMLYQLAQQTPFTPKKYFSIDRVFRNETVDATHLAEFHQVEGLIADRNLTLGHLIGFLDIFFKKLGVKDLRFKPTYNPYTEPSLEVFSYHAGLKKWVEVGNSGMFRPEMLEPMGLPSDVRVIAWGLSLERPTMIKYGINNIRELLGHKCDLNMIRSNPMCRLDK